MIIDYPRGIPELRKLWKQAFGDADAYLDLFYTIAFSPDRCRCVYEDDVLTAALYWFDCQWEGKQIAYLYAIATDADHRNKGYCCKLLADTHLHLLSQGYAGCILVPREAALFGMYEKLGYRTCSCVRTFSCTAAAPPVSLRRIAPEEYASLRRQFLPAGGVLQEGAALALLGAYSDFYTGENMLLAAYPEGGKLTVCELLGSPDSFPGVIAALGYSEGMIRTPGQEKPFAMYHSLTGDDTMPKYFGLALD